jgi:hypothetical protein
VSPFRDSLLRFEVPFWHLKDARRSVIFGLRVDCEEVTGLRSQSVTSNSEANMSQIVICSQRHRDQRYLSRARKPGLSLVQDHNL